MNKWSYKPLEAFLIRPTNFDSIITRVVPRAGLIKENLSFCYYVGRIQMGVGAYGYLGENPKFLNETAA